MLYYNFQAPDDKECIRKAFKNQTETSSITWMTKMLTAVKYVF